MHSDNAFPKSFIIIVISVNCECCQYSSLFFLSPLLKSKIHFLLFLPIVNKFHALCLKVSGSNLYCCILSLMCLDFNGCRGYFTWLVSTFQQ